MEHRYSLRFESGERRGETVAVGAHGLTVGRRPGHSLQILDNSVSGNHAELVVDANGVLVRDLGSTNGTRVREERIVETRLAHGDAVGFGNVKLTFLDRAIDAPLPGPAAPPSAASIDPALAATASRAGEAIERVSADVVARSKKVSPLGLVVLGVLIAGGAGAWWWLEKSGRSARGASLPVAPVAGNLLAASYSFEVDNDGWEAHGEAPVAFQHSAEARISGDSGLAADLSGGEWALHRSPVVGAPPGGALEIRAGVQASRGAIGWIGIEFAPAADVGSGGPGPVIAWSSASGRDGERALELVADVPPGYDSARAVLRASAVEPGSVHVDDVVILPQSFDPAQSLQVGEVRWTSLGRPPSCANLSKVDRALITSLRLCDEDGDAQLSPAEEIAVSVSDGRITFGPPAGSPARKRLSLRAEPPLARAGIATIAGDGYRTHGLDFEREGVTSLLLGGGRDLVRFLFSEPVSVRGRQSGPASAIVASAQGTLATVGLQLDFKDERTRAGDLAHAARNAEKRGELGEALKQWSLLLDGFPFEETLVAEAETTRGRLIQAGLAELRAVRAETERARFFRLVDLFRQCRDKARAVGARYSSSEVEVQARELATEVELDLGGLEADLNQTERERLSAILRALEAEQASGLAAEVREYLETDLGAAK